MRGAQLVGCGAESGGTSGQRLGGRTGFGPYDRKVLVRMRVSGIYGGSMPAAELLGDLFKMIDGLGELPQ
ncbi:MAG: hypothetical protein L0H39_01580, partial [Brachybacterium sp.]|nr:hypothetical protein [Brachybacterium sp.]